MLHIPLLRQGQPYDSLDRLLIRHHRTGEPWVEVSQANAGLIRRDLLRQEEMHAILAGFSTAELMSFSRRAADIFTHDALPLGEALQTPADYVEQVSATTGLPWVLVRRNMAKIAGVMAQIEDVLAGLTRNLDLRVLDDGYATLGGQAVSFFPRGHSLGVVLPSNSPGVHSLWVPAIVLKTPLILKPGSAEPWTPYRIIQAFLKAGCPAEVFGYYPTDHAGSGEVLRLCGRGMVFGDVGAMKRYAGDPRIELHGPGYSKVMIGDDAVDDWEQYIDVIARSIAENSGRSCVNASGVWVTRHGDRIAEALAERLARIQPRAAEDPEAELAPFAEPAVAQRISAMVDEGLEEPGASEVTARFRSAGRLTVFNDCTYLLPTVIRCGRHHPLANREFLFPFASVVEVGQDQLPDAMGPTLVLTAITSDRKLRDRILKAPHIGRLNFGPIQTNHIVWNQPHEGNLFDHLYCRRAFQAALEPAAV